MIKSSSWNTITTILFFCILIYACTANDNLDKNQKQSLDKPYIMVLGIAQDAGYPQAQCNKKCCVTAWKNSSARKMVSCLAIVDPPSKKYYLIDATPDIKYQMKMVESKTNYALGGIFLTHAHIGHYTGLMHLGREAVGADNIPVYAMPRMAQFLSTNGPWSQLVQLKNIKIIPLQKDSTISLNESLSLSPHIVPHRDEYSETVGFKINGPRKSGWFIPDINKWTKWDRDIRVEIQSDFLFIDGTFFENGEIPGRDMSDIPHPFIAESMELLRKNSKEEKSKVHFIHFNHTNPALWDPKAKLKVEEAGFNLATEGQTLEI